jgi:hypothetical protein
MFFISCQDFIDQNYCLKVPANLNKNEFCNIFIIKYKKPISLYDYFLVNENKINVTDKIYENDLEKPDLNSNSNLNLEKKNKMNKLDFRIENKELLIDKFYNDYYINAKELYRKFYKAYLHYNIKPDYWEYRNIFLDEEKTKLSTQRNDSAKRIIRNLFYKELLEYTQISTSLPNKKTMLSTWNELFNELKLDDRYFAPSVLDLCLLQNQPIHYFFQQYQPKASILNPYTIYFLFDFYFPDLLDCTDVIYTPVLSWSSYGLAFCFSKKWKHYLGTDVMKSVCEKTNFLINHFNYSNKSFEIKDQPSEILVMPEYFEKVDLVIFCPPYYKMEIYHENKNIQSIELYPEYDKWLEHYWKQTVENCYLHLKKNGIFSFIIGNYIDYVTKKLYNLFYDCNQYMQNDKWKKIAIIELVNRTSPLRNNSKIRSEYLCVYRKM